MVEDQETPTIRPLIDWLDYNGYQMVTKPVREFTDTLGRRRIKGNMDIELAIDAIELAKTADHLVIFSGDGNFTSLVAALQRKGCRVTVVSTMATRPPMISGELRREADHFIDLAKLRGEIAREHAEVGPVGEKDAVGEVETEM
ncbi:NYN domain-containing protein [Sinorhizobium meliloti]|nr:NYN domain-containing protein [Sinorhizobium meliloti]MDE3822862.1 NYN domain-containing protein [Sinorhizobium meliloti]QND30289.1 NYN domain-containing protein [Sinorhizobium meliloti]QPI28405.1 NYN domain-containing protein [Sinorhizobium meliloti]